MTLVRLMVKLLGKGVAIEFCAPRITLQPGDGESVRLLAALDGHWRRVHGMKTHSSEGKPGRKALLHPDRLPEVRAMLPAEGAPYAGVAAQLGVGRSTLYEFLDRQRAAGNACLEGRQQLAPGQAPGSGGGRVGEGSGRPSRTPGPAKK